MPQQPFAATMVRDAQYFVGRWGEIQQVVEALERRTPALVVGPTGSGRSSLLYHVVAAAPVLFDETELVAHYIDVAGFPDVASIEIAIAQAFQQPVNQWLRMVPSLTHPPLLAFDNVDTPHLAPEFAEWWHRLWPVVRAGHLRCVATAQVADPRAPWRVVTLRPIDGATVNELVVAALGEDGPRLPRNDQEWIMRQSQGHMATAVALLAQWHQAGHVPTWRANMTITSGSQPAWPTAATPSTDMLEREVVDVVDGTGVVPPTDSAQDGVPVAPVQFVVPPVLWWIAVCLLVGLVWWWLKGW